MSGSVATRRRARLRCRARSKDVGKSLAFLSELICSAASSPSRFGRFLHEAITAKSIKCCRAQRDLFPLPIACQTGGIRPAGISHAAVECLLKLVNSSITALNFLHYGKAACAHDQLANRAQRASIDSLTLRWWRLAKHLGGIGGSFDYDPLCYQRLVKKKRANAAIPLLAESVDQLGKCSEVDASYFLPPEVRHVLNDPACLFDDSEQGFTPQVRFSSGSRAEYALLLRRQCRTGKVVFGTSCRNAAGVFAIEKSTPGRQREVWDGSALSKITIPPPAPPWLASPSNLGMLECSDDEPLWMSIRDGTCFFDQLRLPEVLREYVAKPFITMRELCEFDYKGGKLPEQAPLSPAELSSAVVDKSVLEGSGSQVLYPMMTCWPMGHSWSSMVAQYVMTGTCREAGVSTEQFLSDENGLPPVRGESISVATDDVILFERGSVNSMQSSVHISPLFTKLDSVWAKHGIESKASKHVDRTLDGTALGVSLVRGKFLMPKAQRLIDLICAIRNLLEHPFTSPKDFGCFFGLLQWVILTNRPLLACCEQVYNFIDANDPIVRRIPAAVLSELALVSSLLCCLVVDLRCSWTDFISATDGAESFGYGGVRAPCAPELTRKIANHAETLFHCILPSDVLDSPEEVPDEALVMPISLSEFRSTFSLKREQDFHASKLEVGAVCIALKGIARNMKNHKRRTVVLVDSLAVLHAGRKGRSSANNLRHGLRMIASLSLASELRVHYGYIPSRWNPSDPESRGKTGKRQNSGDQQPLAFTKLVATHHARKKTMRRLQRLGHMSDHASSHWASTCSSSVYGQPSLGL